MDKLTKNMILSSGEYDKEKEYWINKLSGELDLSAIQMDFTADQTTVYQKETQCVNISQDLTGKILSISKGSNYGTFMILLSGIIFLLHKYSGSNDIVAGMPVYKRKTEGRYLNNYLPVRINFEEIKTFKELLYSINQTIKEADENKNYPIDMIAELLKIIPDKYSNSIFNTMVYMDDIHDRDYLNDKYINTVFSFAQKGETIDIILDYNSSLYRKEKIESVLKHLIRYYQQITDNTDSMLSQIKLLSEEEEESLIKLGTNQPVKSKKPDYFKGKTIHQLFEDQAGKTPEKTAVYFEDQSITYDELNKKANQLAELLREKGIKPNDTVGIFMDRSIQVIIAIFGTLKAGGAIVPINTIYPDERIIHMLNDSEVKLILINQDTGDRPFDPQKLLNLEELKGELEKHKDVNLPLVNKASDLLYIIYTSGTTGLPKGVMIEHRNIINLIKYQYQFTDINFASKVMQFTNICFDVCYQEIFSTLLCGGELYIISEQKKKDMNQLFEFIAKNDINIVFLPTSLLKFIFSEPLFKDKIPVNIKHIITAGEQLIISNMLRDYITANNTVLHNHYGPSETHVVTALSIKPSGPIEEVPTIGKPISNTTIYIMTADHKLSPVGITGELYIAGDSVGRGYVKKEELTKERFIESPFAEEEIIYKTGDLARWLPDGNIEYLGRSDHQTKIRGYRIELGEIEAQLINNGLVKEALVAVKNDDKGTKFLCAYFTAKEPVPSQKIRDYLSQKLPEYMIPAYFVQMDKMPLNNNGKIDRKALPEPDLSTRLMNEYVAPENELQQKLADLWMKVLNVDKIGIYDNFFSSGGHSILAVKMEIEAEKIKLPFKSLDLFKYQTIKQLSSHMEDSGYQL